MSAADCERWENHLLDLAYGELDAGPEGDVRAHLEGCDHCRASLDKLSRGRSLARALPQLEPPPQVLSAVLRAARDRALEVQAVRTEAARRSEEAVPVPAERPSEPEPSWWTGLLAFAMSPQFAMVSLLVLTVGVGLWWFPGVTGVPPTAPPLLSEPGEAAAPPESLAPAEPLRFDVDPRTGRVEAVTGAGAGVEVARRERPARAPVAGGATEDGRGEEARTDGPEALGEAPVPGLGPVGGEPAAAATTPSGALPSPSPPSEPAGAAFDPARDALPDDGELRAEPPDGPTLLAAAMLGQARELARTGHDLEAAARYEALLERHPTAADAPRAMVELAAVYRRLGRVGRARSWLERASGHPAVESAARRELLRLEASEASPVVAVPDGE